MREDIADTERAQSDHNAYLLWFYRSQLNQFVKLLSHRYFELWCCCCCCWYPLHLCDDVHPLKDTLCLSHKDSQPKKTNNTQTISFKHISETFKLKRWEKEEKKSFKTTKQGTHRKKIYVEFKKNMTSVAKRRRPQFIYYLWISKPENNL